MLISRTTLAIHFSNRLPATLAALSSPPSHTDLGIGVWEGPIVFTSVRSRGGPQTPISISSQSSASDSPISVSSSSPSPIHRYRPRAVPRFNSPASRSAFTPPPQHSSPANSPARRIHPFFLRKRGAAPTPTEPRYVPNYTSTEAESESTSASQSSVYSTASSHRSTDSIKELTHDLGKIKVDGPPKTEAPARRMSTRLAKKPLEKAQSMPDGARGMSTMIPKSPTPLPPAEIAIVSEPQPQAPVPTFSLPADPDPSLPFFTYKNSPSPFTVKYTRSPDEADILVDTLQGDIIGFDMEWPIWGKKTWNSAERRYKYQQGKTALVQLCDEQTVILIHLQNNMDLPSKVAALIRDPKKYKLGVQCRGDGQKLARDFPHHFPPGRGPTSLFELSWMAKAVDYRRIGERGGTGLIALATLTRSYLGEELEKDQNVRAGNWAGELNERQRDYAANDVVVAIKIYNKLKNLAQERGITLHHDLYCSNLNHVPAQPLGPTRSLPANAFTSQANSANPTVSGVQGVQPPQQGAGGKVPEPEKMAALNEWLSGSSCEVIAKATNIKKTVAESYVTESISILGTTILKPEHVQRLLVDFSPGTWRLKKNLELHQKLTKMFGEQNAAVSYASGPVSGVVSMQPAPAPAPKTVSMKPPPKKAATNLAPAAQPGGVKPPTPAKMAALNAFMGGKSCKMIAKEKNVKIITIEGYVAEALSILGTSALPPAHLERIWKEFSHTTWFFDRNKPLYDHLTAVFGVHPEIEAIEEGMKERERVMKEREAQKGGTVTDAASAAAAPATPAATTGSTTIQMKPPARQPRTGPAPAAKTAPPGPRVYPSPRVPYPTEAQLGFNPPSPARMAALNDFMSGKDCWEIGEEKGIQEKTIENYVVEAVAILGIGYVQKSDLERLWTEFPSSVWVYKQGVDLYKDITNVLGSHPKIHEVEEARKEKAEREASRAAGEAEESESEEEEDEGQQAKPCGRGGEGWRQARSRAIARNKAAGSSSGGSSRRRYSSGSSGYSSYGGSRYYSDASRFSAQSGGWRGKYGAEYGAGYGYGSKRGRGGGKRSYSEL
ncbi:hypothetical protein IAR50_007348 [Cryptococcus sp. DSM 104548]